VGVGRSGRSTKLPGLPLWQIYTLFQRRRIPTEGTGRPVHREARRRIGRTLGIQRTNLCASWRSRFPLDWDKGLQLLAYRPPTSQFPGDGNSNLHSPTFLPFYLHQELASGKHGSIAEEFTLVDDASAAGRMRGERDRERNWIKNVFFHRSRGA